jgi:hypothetical protein
MKLAAAFAAMLFIMPVAAFAQGPGNSGRGVDKNVGPASENRDSGPYGGPSSMAPSGGDPADDEQQEPPRSRSNQE